MSKESECDHAKDVHDHGHSWVYYCPICKKSNAVRKSLKKK